MRATGGQSRSQSRSARRVGRTSSSSCDICGAAKCDHDQTCEVCAAATTRATQVRPRPHMMRSGCQMTTYLSRRSTSRATCGAGRASLLPGHQSSPNLRSARRHRSRPRKSRAVRIAIGRCANRSKTMGARTLCASLVSFASGWRAVRRTRASCAMQSLCAPPSSRARCDWAWARGIGTDPMPTTAINPGCPHSRPIPHPRRQHSWTLAFFPGSRRSPLPRKLRGSS